MKILPNQVSFIFDKNKREAQDNIVLASRKINFVHANFDNPDTEFDLIVEDMLGNEQLVKRGCKNPTGRWGESVNLPVNENECQVRVENVKGAKKIDLFFE